MYTIPIVPPDLRHEETIIQAALALDCLQKTINSVFERIDCRVARNNDKVQDLKQRITKAQNKIKGLVGTKKAIKIYSTARFPASHVFHDIPLTFLQPTSDGESMQKEEDQPLQYEIKSRVEPLAKNALQEKLVFFHVRSTERPGTLKTLAATKQQVNMDRGLGTIPERLKSVNSLLLFNSDERVYAVGSDDDLNSWKRARLFKNQRQHKVRVTDQKQLMEPAPFSLANKQTNRQRFQAQSSLFYTPRPAEAPEIDLPLDLPDLPGIADDIHFEGKEQRQIAPSLFIENLPDLSELQTTKDVERNFSSSESSNQQQVTISTTPATPPPPPPMPAPPVIVAEFSPPPPPPPPKAASAGAVPIINKTHFTQTNPGSGVNATGDVRSDLMDAIRKAGGAQGGRLRAAADVAAKSTTQPSSKAKSPGGDLMADLHNKLLMRRKGISGAKGNDTATAISTNPVINRLSSLIPPPPVVRRNASQNAGEDDYDDDDDAEDNDTDWAD